jgi:hypothetical protein
MPELRMRTIGRLSTVLILFLTACVTVDDAPQENGLSFIHLNATYRVDAVEERQRGGFGRVATIARELKAGNSASTDR